jgi:hypothetical protein
MIKDANWEKGFQKNFAQFCLQGNTSFIVRHVKECYLHVKKGRGKNDSWKCIMKHKIKQQLKRVMEMHKEWKMKCVD